MAEVVIDGRGAMIVAEQIGEPAGRPIILNTGIGGSMLRWPDAFCERLVAKGFRVFRFDNRDTGKSSFSEPGKPDYGVDEMASDIIAILDRFGVLRSHYFGLSMGGIIGQLAALEYPERLASLTMMSTTKAVDAEPDLPPPSARLLNYLSTTQPPDWGDRQTVIEYQVGFAEACTGAKRPFSREAAIEINAREYDRARSVASGSNHTKLTGGERWHGHLHEIALPVCVLHGDEDPLFPIAHAHALVRTIAAAELVVLDGAGHEFNEMDWDAIVSAIERTANRAG